MVQIPTQSLIDILLAAASLSITLLLPYIAVRLKTLNQLNVEVFGIEDSDTIVGLSDIVEMHDDELEKHHNKLDRHKRKLDKQDDKIQDNEDNIDELEKKVERIKQKCEDRNGNSV